MHDSSEYTQLALTGSDLENATPEELSHIKEQLQRALALRSPLDYAMYTSPSAERTKHHEYLNNILVALVEKRLYKSGPGPVGVRVFADESDKKGKLVHPETGEPVLYILIVSLPPRRGKSWLVGENMPAWLLTKYPDERLIYLSYNQGIAKLPTEIARNKIREHPELGVELDPDHQAGGDWRIKGRKGVCWAIGIGGGVTGKGGNGIVDDSISGTEEALNPEQLKKKIVWWKGEMKTRIESEKFLIFMGTRWSYTDIPGYFLETQKDSVFVVNIPGLAFEETNGEGVSIDIENENRPDPLGRRPGEPLWPELFSKEEYEATRRELGFWFEAEFQGRPMANEDSMFPSFNYFEKRDGVYIIHSPDGVEIVSPSSCIHFSTMDLAATTSQTADYTVISTFAKTQSGKLLVVHVERVRINSSKHTEWFYQQYALLKSVYDIKFIGIEKASYGLTLIQNIQADGRVHFRRLIPNKDKVARAYPASISNNAGKLYLLSEAPWLTDTITELSRFPTGAHDDIVDTIAYGELVAQTLQVPKSIEKLKKDSRNIAVFPGKRKKKQNLPEGFTR